MRLDVGSLTEGRSVGYSFSTFTTIHRVSSLPLEWLRRISMDYAFRNTLYTNVTCYSMSSARSVACVQVLNLMPKLHQIFL